MLEFTALQLAVLASLFAAGIGVGWVLRSDRSARERIAANAGWQEQLESSQAENDRLHGTLAAGAARAADDASVLRAQEEKISRLRRQLAGWHARLPPLVERHHERERELAALEAELARASARVTELEALHSPDPAAGEAIDEDAAAALAASDQPR